MPTLELSRLWGGGDTPIKFDLWYECSRDPNNGKATYCVYGRIKALTSKQGKFGYPINMEVSIKKSTDTNWSAFNWVKTGTSSCDFKASSPINWDQDIQYNTSNKQIDASPGENVQLKLRIYSNGASAVAGRDITFTYSNLVVPALQTATLVSVADFEIKTSTRLTTVTMRGYNANYTYSLDISYNGVSLISRNSLNVTASGDVYTANIAIGNSERNTIYGKLPNNGSVRATCTLTTKNGNTIIGSSSTQCVCTIPDSVKPGTPTVTTTRVWRGSGTDVGQNLYIQGVTSIQLSNPSASPGSGAEIMRYVAALTFTRADNSTATYNYDIAKTGFPYTIPLDDWGTVDMVFTVFDSRGRSTSNATTGMLYVREYHAPQITSYASYRCNVDGADTTDGKYFRTELSLSTSSFSNTNFMSIGAGGVSGYREVVYNGTPYYSATTVDNIPSGSQATCHMQDPRGSAGGGAYVAILLDNYTVAGGPGVYNASYILDINSNVEITYDTSNPAMWYMYISTALDVNNTSSILVEYKPSTATTWISGGTYTTGNTEFQQVIGGGQIETDQAYDIKYTINDKITTTGISVVDYLSSAEFTIFLSKGGKGVSIGEVYTPTGSDKVLNVSNDWSLSRGGQPAVREDSSGWVIHDLGDGYIEMWKEIDCSNVSGWTLWGSGIYYSTTQFNEYYPYQITFDGAPFVTATVRTYYTSATNHPNLWLVTDAQSSSNTESEHTEMTPTYVLARVGTLGNAIDAKIAIHVMGKLVSS